MATLNTQFHFTAGPGAGEISLIAYNTISGSGGSFTLAKHILQTGVTTHLPLIFGGGSPDPPAAVAWNSFDSQMIIIWQENASTFNIGIIDTNTGNITDITSVSTTTTSPIKSVIAPITGVIISLHADGTIVQWNSGTGEVQWETTWSGNLNFTGDSIPQFEFGSVKIRTLAVNPTNSKIYCVLDSSGQGVLQAIASFNFTDTSPAGDWDIDVAKHLLLDHTQTLVWM